jgi:hypothetical protein
MFFNTIGAVTATWNRPPARITFENGQAKIAVGTEVETIFRDPHEHITSFRNRVFDEAAWRSPKVIEMEPADFLAWQSKNGS